MKIEMIRIEIPCKPTNITTLVFPFFGVKDGFPGSNILHSSLNIAWIIIIIIIN